MSRRPLPAPVRGVLWVAAFGLAVCAVAAVIATAFWLVMAA